MTEKRAKFMRALAARDWRDNKEARSIRNPKLAEIYNSVYGRLYELQEQMTGGMYASQ